MTTGNPILLRQAGTQPTYATLRRRPSESAAAGYSEDLLQRLVEANPELLPVRDFLPSTTSVASLGREIPVDVGGRMGYIDNLLVTNEGRLVLVETKLWRNPEATREVIAQVLQYGMAITAMTLDGLEACLRAGTLANLGNPAQAGGVRLPGMVEDFEGALERHLRMGELLYLIVSDGIRHSAERLTNWISASGSAPFKLGMVELQLYDTGDGATLVIPRTLLKTVEISRHVVTVDIRPTAAATASATVEDRSRSQDGEVSRQERSIAPQAAPMTRERLIESVAQEVGPEQSAFVDRLTSLLQARGLQSRGTSTQLQFGFTAGDGTDYHPLISLAARGAYSHPSFSLIAAMGGEEFVSHKQRLNQQGPFYRPQDAADPTKQKHELVPSYATLLGHEEGIATEIGVTRDIAMRCLDAPD